MLICGLSFWAQLGARIGPLGVCRINGRILLANLLQSSRSTLSRGSFLSFLAFKEGMLSTLISVLGGWPTVSGRLRAAEAITQEENCLQR